jgi:hypothetical protein
MFFSLDHAKSTSTWRFPKINGIFRILNWRYLPYIRPIFEAYVREHPQKIWPYMVQYLHFRILNFPLTKWGIPKTGFNTKMVTDLDDLGVST